MHNKSNLYKKAISVFTGIAFLFLGYLYVENTRVNPQLSLNSINRNTLHVLHSESNKQLNSKNTLAQLQFEISNEIKNTEQMVLSSEEEKFNHFISECLISHINNRNQEFEYTLNRQDYLNRINQIMQGLEVTRIDLKKDKIDLKFSDASSAYNELASSLEILCHLNYLEGNIQCPTINLERAEQLAYKLVTQDSLNSYPYILLSLVYDKLQDQHKATEVLIEAETKTDHFNIYFESNSQKLIQLYETIDDYIFVSQVTSTLPMPNLFKIGKYLKSKKSFFVFHQMLKKNLNPNFFLEGINVSYLEYYVAEKFLESKFIPVKGKEFIKTKDVLYKKDLYKNLKNLDKSNCDAKLMSEVLNYFKLSAM